jgi:hypothetical protein
LEHFCKIYEKIGKIEKEKKQRRENMKMDPGKRFGPELKRARGPFSKNSEPVPLTPLPLADVWAPHVSTIFSPISSPSLSVNGNGRSYSPGDFSQ